MQATSSVQRLEEKFGEVGEAVRVNANLSDHLAEIFSIIFKDPQQSEFKQNHVLPFWCWMGQMARSQRRNGCRPIRISPNPPSSLKNQFEFDPHFEDYASTLFFA